MKFSWNINVEYSDLGSALEKAKGEKDKRKKKIEEWNDSDCGMMLSGLRRWEEKRRE